MGKQEEKKIKVYRVFAPNGKYVNLFFAGKMVYYKHGELVTLDESIAEQFSGIFYEVEDTRKEKPEEEKIEEKQKEEEKQDEKDKKKDKEKKENTSNSKKK